MLPNYGCFDECAVCILHPEVVDSRFLQIVGTYLHYPTPYPKLQLHSSQGLYYTVNYKLLRRKWLRNVKEQGVEDEKNLLCVHKPINDVEKARRCSVKE
jgi:hypothetical protein